MKKNVILTIKLRKELKSDKGLLYHIGRFLRARKHNYLFIDKIAIFSLVTLKELILCEHLLIDRKNIKEIKSLKQHMVREFLKFIKSHEISAGDTITFSYYEIKNRKEFNKMNEINVP